MSISEKIEHFLETAFPGKESSVFKDLSLNFKKLMEDSSLDPVERFLNIGAIGRSLHWKGLEHFAQAELQALGVAEAEIAESFEAAAIMGMLNTYYKFKSFLHPEVLADTAYQRAGLRMNSLSKPLNGKEKFEMMALSVSVVNGCQTCVSSHEKALTDIGVSRDKIHDLARLASVTKGLSHLH